MEFLQIHRSGRMYELVWWVGGCITKPIRTSSQKSLFAAITAASRSHIPVKYTEVRKVRTTQLFNLS